MEEVKPFWASRTIWVGLVGVLFPLLGAAGWLPAGLSQEQVVSAVMGVLGVLTILFRARASAALLPPGKEAGR